MVKSPEQQHPEEALGWAAGDASGSGQLSPFKFSRGATGEKDVKFKVLFCGICHSDLHSARNDRGFSTILFFLGTRSRVKSWRSEARWRSSRWETKWASVAWSDRAPPAISCHDHLENYCPKALWTYGSIYHDGTTTYGGYSNVMVVDEHFAVKFPQNMPLDASAPLLCAGITVYSSMRFFGLDHPGDHLGVVGLGGLGHVAVKFAKAMGLKVMVISTSPGKQEEALQHLGADAFVVNINQVQAAMGTMDSIIDTVSAVHPLLPLIGSLKNNGKLVLIGIPDRPLELPVFPLLSGTKIVVASCVSGLKETQEMIDFTAKHNITANIEVVPINYLNTAMNRLTKADVKYRFVIDIGNTLKEA